MNGTNLFRIVITTSAPEEMCQLLRRHTLDLNCGGPVREPDGTISVEAFVTQQEIDSLSSGPWKLEVLENASEVGAQRQLEVGRGNRFAEARAVPRGLGIKE